MCSWKDPYGRNKTGRAEWESGELSGEFMEQNTVEMAITSKRCGQARSVYVKSIKHNIPTTWERIIQIKTPNFPALRTAHEHQPLSPCPQHVTNGNTSSREYRHNVSWPTPSQPPPIGSWYLTPRWPRGSCRGQDSRDVHFVMPADRPFVDSVSTTQ